MRFFSLKYIIVWIIAFQSCLSMAQGVYNHRVYYEKDGLLSSQITDITQAKDGTIWVNTILGVSQYDGSQWTNYPNTEFELPKDDKAKIKSLDDGTIWVAGHREGKLIISYWKDGIWNKLPPPPKNLLSEPYYYSGFSFDIYAKNGIFKIAINELNLSEYDLSQDKWTIINDKNVTKPNTIFTIKYDNEGILWVGTINGLKSWNRNKLSDFIQFKENNEKPAIYSIAFSKDSNIPFLLGQDWIGKVNQSKIEVITNHTSPYPNNYVNEFSELIVSNTNEFLYFSFSPLKRFNGKEHFKVEFDHDLSNTTGNKSALIDYEGNIWIATVRGLIKLNSQNFTNYNRLSGLIDNEVSAIYQLKNRKEVLVAGNQSYSFFSEGTFSSKKIKRKTVIENTRILRILESSDGNIYFAANNRGLGILNKKNEVTWYNLPSTTLNVINEIFEFQNKIYAIRSRNIYQFKENKTFTKISASPREVIRKVQVTSKGQVLLLANDIFEFKGDTVIKRFSLTNPYVESIYGICEWNGKLLVATRQGLQEAKEDSIKPIVLNEQPIAHPVYGLLVDSRNNLWVGTSKGVYHFADSVVHYYTPSNGLIGNEVNRNALIEDANGKIWIGTEKGISIYDYETTHTPPSSPLLKINSIRTDKGTRVNTKENITLSADENDIEFSFVGISFREEEEINYRYRLIDLNNEWEYLPSNHFTKVRYNNLQHGDYRFEFQARNGKEEWTPSLYSGTIHIKRSFIKSPLFFILIFIIAIIIGITIQIFVTQKKHQQLLRKKITEKVFQIKSSEKELEAKNRELNSLNKELDRFVYSVSHDLKSPLSSIEGLIEAIKISSTQEEKDTFFNLIEKSAKRLKKFITDLEALARNKRTGLEKAEVNFDDLMKINFDAIAYSTEAKNVEITFNVNQDRKFISDINRVNIIINNLISNGIRYRKEYIEDAFVKINISVSNENAMIVISDNGIGIPEDRIDKIFEMFEKGETKREGSSGLGLHIVKETVEKLNGTIHVESTINQGTTFTVKLPNLVSD